MIFKNQKREVKILFCGKKKMKLYRIKIKIYSKVKFLKEILTPLNISFTNCFIENLYVE